MPGRSRFQSGPGQSPSSTEVTAAAAGTIKLNLILLFNVAVVRESSFARVEAKHA